MKVQGGVILFPFSMFNRKKNYGPIAKEVYR